MPMQFSEITTLAYKNGVLSYKAIDGTYVPVLDYTKQTMKLVQAGTAAPTATILGNDTFGTPIVWTRTGVGVYNGNLVGGFTAFTAGKTVPKYAAYTPDGHFIKVTVVDANNISVVQLDQTFAAVDGITVPFDLEIQVYS